MISGRLFRATPSLQWGHDEGVVEGIAKRMSATPRLRGFNGATTKESWKSTTANAVATARSESLQWGHDEGVVEDDGRSASMCGGRRLQWGHDEGVVEDWWTTCHGVRVCASFNGATTMESWKT